jgi:hypothetical protein
LAGGRVKIGRGLSPSWPGKPGAYGRHFSPIASRAIKITDAARSQQFQSRLGIRPAANLFSLELAGFQSLDGYQLLLAALSGVTFVNGVKKPAA